MANSQLSMRKYINIRYHPYTKYWHNSDNINAYKKKRKTQVMNPLKKGFLIQVGYQEVSVSLCNLNDFCSL